MMCNVGPTESYIRMGVGAATGLLALTLPMDRWLRGVLGLVAISELVTGYTRYCPINQLLGINNCAGWEGLRKSNFFEREERRFQEERERDIYVPSAAAFDRADEPAGTTGSRF